MKKEILLLLFIAIYQQAMFANDLTQNIRGKVTDMETGYPLIGANVFWMENTQKGTVTDENGNFVLNDIPIGRQSIEVRYIGYKRKQINNLYLNSGKEMFIEVQLEEDAFELEQIVVKANAQKEKPLNEMAPVSARTFSVEETERYAGSLGDPARMAANFAGVMTQSDARNDIIIRGNSPMGVLWMLEGIEIPNPNHFGALGTTGGPVSMLNNNLLANSDFLTGAFPAEYGNATSGVFDLNMRSGNSQTTEYTGQIGFNGFEGGVEGPMFSTGRGQKASYLINYRYSTLDLVNKIGINTGTGTAVPEYQDASFIIDLPGTKAGRFKLIGLWGTSHILIKPDTINNLYGTPGTITDFGSDLAMTGLTHTYFFNEKMSLKSSVSAQNVSSVANIDSIKYESDRQVPMIRSFQAEQKYNLSSRFGYKINARNNLEAGVKYDIIRPDFLDSIRLPEYHNIFRTTADITKTMGLFRAFAQHQYKLSPKVTTYTGLHYQHFDLNNESALEPRAGLNIELSKKHLLSLGYGMHSQLQPRIAYFHREYNNSTNAYEESTNTDLGFTKSNHYVLSYDYFVNKDLRIKAESYYQKLYNVPVKESFEEFSLINAGDFFGLPREDSLVNKGKGENYGIELTIEKFLSNSYYFLFTTSLFESRYTGYDGQWRNTAFNGNYVLNLLGGYEKRVGENSFFTIDMKLVLAGGKRYVPLNLEETFEQKTQVYYWEDAYNNKYPEYFRADIRLGFKMNNKKFSQEWGLDLQNITNHQSLFMEGVDMENEALYQIYQQGFYPMMLYRIQF
ncbi:MAG: TonB-dependent receptor [Bacteroidota bacterium]